MPLNAIARTSLGTECREVIYACMIIHDMTHISNWTVTLWLDGACRQ